MQQSDWLKQSHAHYIFALLFVYFMVVYPRGPPQINKVFLETGALSAKVKYLPVELTSGTHQYNVERKQNETVAN